MGLKLWHGLSTSSGTPSIRPSKKTTRISRRSAGHQARSLFRQSPLNGEGHGWFQYTESRKVGYEDQAKDPNQKKARDDAHHQRKEIAAGGLRQVVPRNPESFLCGVGEKSGRGPRQPEAALSALCDEKFGEASPSFGKLKNALDEVRHVAHTLLDKKRETEPDPVVEEPPEPATEDHRCRTRAGRSTFY